MNNEAQSRVEHFAALKSKYQATKYEDSSPSSLLYFILRKADLGIEITEIERNWLREHKLLETLEAIRKEHRFREKELRKLESEFSNLKSKYKAINHSISWQSSTLYFILSRLESGNKLTEPEVQWLKSYGQQLEELQINWLKENGRENIIAIAQEKHFATLKSRYEVSDYKDKSPSSPLYAILQKLEKGERLEPTDVAWLQPNKTEWRQLFSGKIFITYHKIEATFYEQEYERTGNQWNLPNASSHWRKADKPKQALKLTENLNFDKIKENKLKSALLTTRGGAFRDIGDLDKAEKCARQAIEYQPNSHHPYTLMGAICFERGEYSQGEYWFAEAIKRGASLRDQDAEIKRVVKNAKDENKRREVVDYLLKKDPQRYSWAKSYLKKSQNRGK